MTGPAAEVPSRSPLVAVDELLGLVTGDERQRPLLLDVRWTLAGPDVPSYLTGHLPGAVFVDLDADLASPPGAGGRHPLPDAETLTATLRRLGIGADRDVVVYDGGNAMAASRAWWVLRWAGHERVRVLDGGLPAWTEAGGPLESGPVEPVADPAARARVGSMPTVSVDDVAAGRGGLVVDVRAPERFRGEVEPVDPVAGHVPGAVSCPASGLVDDSGRYLPAAALREVLDDVRAGAVGSSGEPVVADGAPLAAQCGSGVTATQLVLAGEVAGVPVALWPGSWSEWVADPSRPVATG
ncbi:sulfurtransferase [Thalassiella azotivora]